MKLDVNTGSIITQEEAKALIAAFKTKFPGEVTSSFIGANNFKKILDQENCIGIRVYNGYDDVNENISLVFVGVDTNETDMLDDGIIYDRAVLCPPSCQSGGLN